MACPNLALICRSADLADLQFWRLCLLRLFFFDSLFSDLQHQRLVRVFKSSDAFDRGGPAITPIVLCSTIVYTRHPLDNCSSRTIFSHLTAFSTRPYPALETTAILTLSTRATSFMLVTNTYPVVPLPPNGHHTLRALLFRLTSNVGHHSAIIWRS